jgi:hypothetical protein
MKTTQLFKHCLVVVALLFCGVLSRSSFAQSCNIEVEALTESGNGIVEIPGPDGANAFALSTTVGVGGCTGFLSASATGPGGVQLLPPLTITLCQTNPQNAECIDPSSPVGSLQVAFGQGAQPTFSVFVKAGGTIPQGSSVCVNFISGPPNNPEGFSMRHLICLPIETI